MLSELCYILVNVLYTACAKILSRSVLLCCASAQVVSRGLMLQLLYLLLFTRYCVHGRVYFCSIICSLQHELYFLCSTTCASLLSYFTSNDMSNVLCVFPWWHHVAICYCSALGTSSLLHSLFCFCLTTSALLSMANTCLLQLPGGISWSAAAIGLYVLYFLRSTI